MKELIQRPPGEITDDALVWFGKYKGRTFEQVPAGYFLNYLDKNCDAKIQRYIDNNRDVLEKEMIRYSNH